MHFAVLPALPHFVRNFAAVFDGASSFSEDQPEHDGGWYAEILAAQLQELLNAEPECPLAAIVERAIEGIVAAHHLEPDTSPTSTIALTRWNKEQIEAYVLGDSTVAIIHEDGSEDVYSDDRLASIGGELRRAYRERLAGGTGFDDQHGELLASLQVEQAKGRNREDGYWIAGAEPEAAHHAVAVTTSLRQIRRAVIASDGVAKAISPYRIFSTWHSLGISDPSKAIEATVAIEESDAAGGRWPRSKSQDDKTLVNVQFAIQSPSWLPGGSVPS